METLKSRRAQSNIFQVLKDVDINLDFYTSKLFAIVERERKLHDINRLKELMFTNLTLQRILEAIFQPKERNKTIYAE